jgi:hypothetical protein
MWYAVSFVAGVIVTSAITVGLMLKSGIIKFQSPVIKNVESKKEN